MWLRKFLLGVVNFFNRLLVIYKFVIIFVLKFKLEISVEK